ncbi:MAG TPA: hypothetical protein DCL75_02445 [Ktedonobacter sp.]|jgi:hypothetical protein|nr:hypothetical protein [Ktedonobacter sp.]HAG97733.1 hypothetical protein [Ktedonobacter sp.]HAT45057.1 hypothetical protein [Ktedonobacter sp.]HBE29010.1 hypothetical protein [Ktedonobacter sp.]
MSLGPAPTQQKPVPEVLVKPEEKKVRSTPARRRVSETPTALFFKAIFRPIFKGIYYLLRAIRAHKLVTFLLLLLLIGSSIFATYLLTQSWPFGVGSDQFNFRVNGKNFSGEHVKNWLYALRDGDASTLSLIGQETAQYVDLATSGTSAITISPRDTNSLITSFSQSKTHLTWKNITVLAVSSAPDTTVDSFVEVDTASSGPGGNVSGIMIWHFITAPQGTIIAISLVSFRAPM